MVKAHGIKGEVVVLPETDYPHRLAPGSRLETPAGEELTISSSIPGERGWLVRFSQVYDRNQAEGLAGVELFVEASERRELGSDEFWPDLLIGLEVRDPAGNYLGRVRDVDDRTPQARLIITTSAGEVEVPFVSALVPEVGDGYLVVDPLSGLI